jgi:hypothetical protein
MLGTIMRRVSGRLTLCYDGSIVEDTQVVFPPAFPLQDPSPRSIKPQTQTLVVSHTNDVAPYLRPDTKPLNNAR